MEAAWARGCGQWGGPVARQWVNEQCVSGSRGRAGEGDADLAGGLGPASLVLPVLLLTNGTLSVMLTNPGLFEQSGASSGPSRFAISVPLVGVPYGALLVSPQPM